MFVSVNQFKCSINFHELIIIYNVMVISHIKTIGSGAPVISSVS